VGRARRVSPRPFVDPELGAKKRLRRPDATDSAVAPDVTRRAYAGCDADVVLYTIHGGGHTWPGGTPLPEWFVGTTSRSVDASTLMWDFFRRHPHR
jgi:polyhydroxybutyrate depolymerase